MPEVHMQIEWPDNKTDVVYSPSSVINEFFKTGDSLPLEDFEKKVVEALTQASGRVLAKYGYECTSAMAEIDRLNSITNKMIDKSGPVKIIKIK